MTISANQAAEIATAVVARPLWRLREPSCSKERRADDQLLSPIWPLCSAGDVLPSALSEEAVVAAGHQLSPILERYAVGGLDACPMGEDFRRHVPPVPTVALCADDPLSHRELGKGLRSPVGQENRCLARRTILARMSATAIRVDRPAERHPGPLGHSIEGGLRADLVETDVERLGCVEVPDDRGLAVARERGALLRFSPQVVPAHEHMFAHPPDGAAELSAAPRGRSATSHRPASCSSLR